MEVLTFGHSTVARRKKKYVPESKNTSQNRKILPRIQTRPRIQNTSQNPKILPRIQKYFPESKTLPRIQKHFQESNTRLRIQKHFWILGSVFGFWEVFCPVGHGTIQLKRFDPTERFFSVALFCLVCCTNCC